MTEWTTTRGHHRPSHGRDAGRLIAAGAASRLVWAIAVVGLASLAGGAHSAPPSEITARVDGSHTAMNTAKPESEVWILERNPVAEPLVRARGITAADEAVPGIPPCGFDRPVFWQTADAIVVDEAAFSDLKTVPGRRAATFAAEGERVGRIVAPGHDPRQVVKLLVHAGIIDANIHASATVEMLAAGHAGGDAWFRLASDASYWTDREHRERFEFGVRVSAAGDILVVHPRSLPQ